MTDDRTLLEELHKKAEADELQKQAEAEHEGKTYEKTGGAKAGAKRKGTTDESA